MNIYKPSPTGKGLANNIVVNKAESVHSVMTTLLLQLLPFRKILNYETIILHTMLVVNGNGVLRKVISPAGIHNEKREVVSNDVNEKEMLKCMN